jgi:hypothetical protein
MEACAIVTALSGHTGIARRLYNERCPNDAMISRATHEFHEFFTSIRRDMEKKAEI